jgi:hypothetical protein
MQNHPPPVSSRLAQLLEHRLGENLHDWIARHRVAGVSWRAIAGLLAAEAGVDITETTLRNWYPDLTAAGHAEREGRS